MLSDEEERSCFVATGDQEALPAAYAEAAARQGWAVRELEASGSTVWGIALLNADEGTCGWVRAVDAPFQERLVGLGWTRSPDCAELVDELLR